MPASAPLVVYKKIKGSNTGTHFIKAGVEKRLNEAGQACYAAGAICSCFRFKWMCHSGRIVITALFFAKYCNFLHIKNHLRLESDKFEVYICHTPMLACLHVEAGRTNIDAYPNQSQAQTQGWLSWSVAIHKRASQLSQ